MGESYPNSRGLTARPGTAGRIKPSEGRLGAKTLILPMDRT
jgi:hypothetical protein